MASRAKKPPGDEATPAEARPARLRVMRPEVEEVLRSPRRGRPKLQQQHKEDADGLAPPRYDCAFQDEQNEGGGLAPPAMVWCKVRSHPWWPAQVFDAADASELALQHARATGGHTLVAYFWDNTFAWTDPAALLPFRASFPRLAAQSTVSSYAASVDAALEEVERRVEAGLSCSCAFAAGVAKKQEVKNSGIREGAYGAVVNDAYMRDTFRGEPFLEYISALAANPLAGADRLDLATATAQLRSFNRLRVPRELPEFVVYEGIEGVAAAEATPHAKRKRMEKGGEDDVVPSKEKQPRRGESSLRKRGGAIGEEAVDEDSSVPRKSSARKKTSKDVDKTELPAKKGAIVEDSSVPSSKQSKSKISKSSAEKKKDSSKDTDKRESLAEPAEEDAANADSSMPTAEATPSKGRKSKISKSSSKTKKKDSSKDAEPAEEDATGEDSSMPTPEATDGTSRKGRKSKVSKSSVKTKKKDISKDADKKESLPEPAEEDATNEDSSMPTAEVTDGTSSKGRKSKSSAKTKKKDTSKGADKKESLTDPAMEEATGDDTSTPSGGLTDDTLSKETKFKISRSSAKKKKQDTSKDADKKESLPEPAEEHATNEDSSMPTVEATDGTLSKERKSSRISAKKKTQEISKDADKKAPLPEPAQEEATGDDSSTPTDGTLSKETKSKTSKSSTKKKKQDTSKGTDGVEPAAGNEMSVNKAVDVTLSDGKSGRTLRSTKKMEDASEGLKGPKKNGAAETTKGKDKDAALLKENNLGRRASSARLKDKITEDGDRLAGSSVKDSVSPGKKKSQVGEMSVTKDSPISEHGRKRKKLSELLVETNTPNRSLGGKSKARGKRSLPVPTEKPDRDTENTVKTRGKRPLPASAKKPDRDTEDTVKTRGKRSLPASAEKPEDPNRDMKDKMKTRGKRSLPESTEEPEDPDRDTKDTMKTTKRKKLDTLGDLSSQPPLSPKGSTKGREATPKAAGKKSQTSLVIKANGDTLGDSSSQPEPLSPKRSTKGREATPKAAGKKSQPSLVVKANGDTLGDSSSKPEPLSPKRSTKVREATRKAAELKPHTSHVVEANGEASQTRSRRTKNSEVTVSDKSPQSVKLNKGKKGASTEVSVSCGEMHSQLCLAASDLKKVGKITPASVGFFTEFSKSSCPSSADVEKEIPIELAVEDADKETPEEAAEKAGSPHANEEIPEEATNKVVSPHADEEIPEKPTDNVPGPSEPPVADHMKDDFWSDISLEPPVADHMKDDYWADILINVEEPISSLKRKKDKSKTSKTKESQAEDASTKEPPVSAGKVEVEEPTAAESKQDNMDNGKAETNAVNGGQPNTEETVAAENLAGLVLHFSRADAVPSRSDLIKIFSQYGPVSEVKTEKAEDNGSSSAQVVFRRRMDAEVAFGGSGKMTSLLGPALVSFRLTDFPGGGAVAASE